MILQACVQVAADNAVFGQTGPKVGSFDAGYGSTQMARLVGQKKAREIWFLARLYTAQQALPFCSSVQVMKASLSVPIAEFLVNNLLALLLQAVSQCINEMDSLRVSNKGVWSTGLSTQWGGSRSGTNAAPSHAAAYRSLAATAGARHGLDQHRRAP